MANLDQLYRSFLGLDEQKEEKNVKMEEPVDAQVIEERKKTVRRVRGGGTKTRGKKVKAKGGAKPKKVKKETELDEEDENLWEKWITPDDDGRISNMDRPKGGSNNDADEE